MKLNAEVIEESAVQTKSNCHKEMEESVDDLSVKIHEGITRATKYGRIGEHAMAEEVYRKLKSNDQDHYSPQEVEQMVTGRLYEVFPVLSKRFAGLFLRFNEEYFSRRLPQFKVEVSYTAGLFIDPWTGDRTAFQHDGAISVKPNKIRIRFDESETVLQSRLLREMARIATGRYEYDGLWFAEIIRLQALGAPVFSYQTPDHNECHFVGGKEVVDYNSLPR